MGRLYEDWRFSWETGLSCTDFVRSPGIVDFLAFCKLQKLLILNDLSCGKNVRLPPPPPQLIYYLIFTTVLHRKGEGCVGK